HHSHKNRQHPSNARRTHSFFSLPLGFVVWSLSPALKGCQAVENADLDVLRRCAPCDLRSVMPPVQGDPVFKSREVFQCLDDARAPTGALGISVGLHITLLSLLILVPLLFPQALHLNYHAILLEPPPPPHEIQTVELKLPPKMSMPKLARVP